MVSHVTYPTPVPIAEDSIRRSEGDYRALRSRYSAEHWETRRSGHQEVQSTWRLARSREGRDSKGHSRRPQPLRVGVDTDPKEEQLSMNELAGVEEMLWLPPQSLALYVDLGGRGGGLTQCTDDVARAASDIAPYAA